MAIFAIFFYKQGLIWHTVQNLQPQHHFSKTRHPSGQSDTYFNLLYLNTAQQMRKLCPYFRQIRWNFQIFGIFSTLKCSSTSSALICMPEGLLREIDQY